MVLTGPAICDRAWCLPGRLPKRLAGSRRPYSPTACGRPSNGLRLTRATDVTLTWSKRQANCRLSLRERMDFRGAKDDDHHLPDQLAQPDKILANLEARRVSEGRCNGPVSSGEGGIRTPGPPFGRHSISSAAQSTTLSPLRGARGQPLFLLGLFFRLGGLFLGRRRGLFLRRCASRGNRFLFGRLLLLPLGGGLFLFGLGFLPGGPQLALGLLGGDPRLPF